MINQMIGTIKLSGQDARTFAMSLYRPIPEEVIRRNSYLDEINKSITITREEDGFQADIADLDLSFLEKQVEVSRVKIKATLRISADSNVYINDNMVSYNTGVVTRTVSQYSRSSANEYFVWAA